MPWRHVVRLIDCIDWAVPRAQTAANALVGVNRERQEVLADASGALLVPDVGDVFLAEELERCQHRVWSSLSQAAQRVRLDVVAEFLDAIKVLHGALALRDLVEQLKKPLGANTTRRALATGLIDGEFQEELGHVNHAGVLVHDDEATGAHHATNGGEVIVVNLGVDQTRGDATTRRTAGLSRLELLSIGDAAADVVDDVLERRAHGNLD